MGEQMNLTDAMSHSSEQRLNLPLLFLQMPADANISISQDDTKCHLKLRCDKNFILRDENALF